MLHGVLTAKKNKNQGGKELGTPHPPEMCPENINYMQNPKQLNFLDEKSKQQKEIVATILPDMSALFSCLVSPCQFGLNNKTNRTIVCCLQMLCFAKVVPNIVTAAQHL